MDEERTNESSRLRKGKGKLEEFTFSSGYNLSAPERGAKSETTGLKVLNVNEVAEKSTTPAQDPVIIITPVVKSQNESPASQGKEMKEADEISDRASQKKKWRSIVNDIRNLQKNDDEEEEREVGECSTPVHDPVDINLQNKSESNQGEGIQRDQADASNFLDRTSLEEKWKNIVKLVLPGEAAVSLEAVPIEVMVQLLKVADKIQGPVNRPAETDQEEVVEGSSDCCLRFYCCLLFDCCEQI